MRGDDVYVHADGTVCRCYDRTPDASTEAARVPDQDLDGCAYDADDDHVAVVVPPTIARAARYGVG